MKIDSKFIGVFSALLLIAFIVSSVGAADNLVSDGIKSDSFSIDVPSGSNFADEAATNINAGDVSMNMLVFENKGDNAKDVSAVMYLKDSSSNQNIISDAINDLEKEGAILEQNDKYFVVETKNADNWDFFNFDIGNGINDFFGFANGLFSSANVDVSSEGNDVNISSNGMNVVSDDGSSVSLSDKGLEVSDANGENVSISGDGVKVSDNGTGGNAAGNVDVSVNTDAISAIENSDYALCIKNPKNDQLIVISGDNLDLLKSMAETASFAEE